MATNGDDDCHEEREGNKRVGQTAGSLKAKPGQSTTIYTASPLTPFELESDEESSDPETGSDLRTGAALQKRGSRVVSPPAASPEPARSRASSSSCEGECMVNLGSYRPTTETINIESRARGCLLGLMVGDALGAAVEGFPTEEIRLLCENKWGTSLVQGFVRAVHMGTYVSAGEPCQYRPATGLRDTCFVPSGPPSNPSVEQQCSRFGMYTDDTNACLAVGMSIVQHGFADAQSVANSCASLFKNNEAYRGIPPTAKLVMQATRDGVPAQKSGLPPHFPYAAGSFANGGAMRIAPLAIAYRSANPGDLRDAVEEVVLSSHRHPEAVDFAVVQAAAVQYCLGIQPKDFNAPQLLADLAARCQTSAMREAVVGTAEALRSFDEGDEREAVKRVVAATLRAGSGMDFQIASVHMAPCVLWTVCRHHADPRHAVQMAIDLGGDTDTTACMVGAVVGALHGELWCADWTSELENGPHGKNFALDLANKLAALDIRD